MKNFKFFWVLLALPLVFTSCTKDEDLLEGSWNVDKYEWEMFMAGQLVESGAETDDGTITFYSDGTGTTNEGDDFDWELDDEELTIHDHDGTTSVYDVEELTSDKLIMNGEDEEEFMGETITIKYTITLSKL